MTIRLAIAGVGNCSSSLVQGLEYYRDADPFDQVPGLMHVVLGSCHCDVEVGRPSTWMQRWGSTSRRSSPAEQHDPPRPSATRRHRAARPHLDGLGNYSCIEERPAEPVDGPGSGDSPRRRPRQPQWLEEAQKHHRRASTPCGVRERHPRLHAWIPWAAKFGRRRAHRH
jgi:myo-inositol-1-phosphate synthase